MTTAAGEHTTVGHQSWSRRLRLSSLLPYGAKLERKQIIRFNPAILQGFSTVWKSKKKEIDDAIDASSEPNIHK